MAPGLSRKFALDQKGGKRMNDQEQKSSDTSETIHISALALLKMLKHGRAGVPLEVMGLMLGEYIDEYTIHVVDVFAMPQTGTGVSVESIDAVFQAKMLDMLSQIDRHEIVVGWYHSHPGFGCWLSSVDCSTQMNFEALHPRAVAVVVDPIQSVRGKVIIDAFRCINTMSLLMATDARSVTSNIGSLRKPPIISIVHGLDRQYYSLNISYRRDECEQKMLMNLQKQSWMDGLCTIDYEKHAENSISSLKKMNELLKFYNTYVKEEEELTPDQFSLVNVGRKDPRKHLTDIVNDLTRNNVIQSLKGLSNSLLF